MTKTLSHYISGIKDGAQLDIRVPQNGSQKAGQIVIVPNFETVQVALAATSASQTVFVCDAVSGSYIVAGISARFGTASTSGTLQVEVAGAGTAVGSGVNQLTGTVSLSGAANTTANGTVVAAPTTVAAGSSINVILAGTLTGLANASISLILQRVA